jgi:hypothetical protein
MTLNVSPELQQGQSLCQICSAPVWRARFGGGHDWRLVETAPPTRSTVGKLLADRNVGHVALVLPLPGTDGEIRGAITKRRTTYRLHACRSFSAGARPSKVRP